MSFKLVMNYKKNAGVENLVHELDESDKNLTFNEVLDYLGSVRQQLKRKNQKILDLALSYRKKHREYLEDERKQGKRVDGQMQIVITTMGQDGKKVDLREENQTYKRPVTNLDRKVKDYVKSIPFKTSEGKEQMKDVLNVRFDYIPVVGSYL